MWEMKRKQNSSVPLGELSWLTEVKVSVQPRPNNTPIWVRHGVVQAGPTIPHPERHPTREISTTPKAGRVAMWGGRMSNERRTIIFLAGLGWRIWYKGTQYLLRFEAAVRFPSQRIH